MSFFQRNDISSASFIFLLVAILQFLASFLLVPVYLNTFSVEEFGTNEIINRVALFVGIIISLRISGAMANIYFSMKTTPDKRSFISSLAGFTVLTSTGGFFFFLATGYYFLKIFPAGNGFSLFPHGICALLTGIAANMTAPYFFYLKNERKLKTFLLISIVFILMNLIIQLVAIYGFNTDFEKVIILRSGIAFIQFLVMFFIYKISFSLSINWLMVRRALSYTVPLIPFLMLNWFQLYYDRLFVGEYFGAIALGAFSFVVILQSIQTTFTDVFENAIRPNLMGQFIRGNYQDGLLAKTQNQYIIALVLASSLLLLLTVSLPLFTSNPLYLDHAFLFMLVIVSGVIKGISLLFMQQLVFKERSFELGVLVAIHFGILYCCYHLFAKQGHWEVVLWINIFTGAFMMCIYFIRAQKVFLLPFQASQFVLPVVFGIMVLLFYGLVEYLSAPAELLLPLQFLIVLFLARTYLKTVLGKVGMKVLR